MTRSLVWKSLFALSIGANAALGTAVAWHRPGPGPVAPAPAGDDSHECLLASLGLEPSQRATIDRLRSEFDGFRREQHVEMRSLRGRLFDALAKAETDRTEIDGILERLGSVQVELRRRLVDQLVGITGVMNADQKSRFLAGVRTRFMGSHGRGDHAPEADSCPAAEAAGRAPAE